MVKTKLFAFAVGLVLLVFTASLALAVEPEMVYPVDGQAIDLEGSYMFKVKPVQGASGYLFGLFQNDVMVYENYRDTGNLSLDGEFSLLESNPAHVNFQSGQVEVMIRALINGNWSEARKITLTLRPWGKSVVVPAKVTNNIQEQISAGATDSSALQRKIDDLQKKLEQSQQKQSELENRLSQIIAWIKSLFPFFK
ncbi:MAG: hypothetical protein Q7R77_03010 [Candidatus Daviesbacteria bacterium]|nr:hypothetical protein [Candidatus Daviesbacteria bacterium]